MSKKYRRRRVSASPLIDPAVSVLVVLAPDHEGFASLRPPVRRSLQRNLRALTAAANIVGAPVFVSSPDSDAHPLAQSLAPGPMQREFAAGTHALPWLHSGFATALAKEDRTALLLAGFWLEYQVLATALHGLADAYDVYLVLDAAPARAPSAGASSRDRLMFAGATPVVTAQVIHEWCLEADDPAKRVALRTLLVELLDRQKVDRGWRATP
jgi:Isochorismatase family